MELTFRLGSLGELEDLLRSQLAKRALVCLSPNRKERCDTPATRIFWQDAGEWYPCCDEHWPGGSRWPDDPHFYGYTTQLIVFAERESHLDLTTAVNHEYHNRADGTAFPLFSMTTPREQMIPLPKVNVKLPSGVCGGAVH